MRREYLLKCFVKENIGDCSVNLSEPQIEIVLERVSSVLSELTTAAIADEAIVVAALGRDHDCGEEPRFERDGGRGVKTMRG